MRFKNSIVTISIVFVFALCSFIQAQEESGIFGSVRMQSPKNGDDGLLVNVRVSAFNSEGAEQATTLSNSRGEFRIPLVPGVYRLIATHPDFLPFDTAEAILQVHENHFTLFNISLQTNNQNSTTVLKGLVKNNNGQPLKAEIEIKDSTGELLNSLESDEDGIFSLVLAPGEYQVTATCPETETSETITATVESGETQDLVIILGKAVERNATIQGLIRYRGIDGLPGRPIAGALVKATNSSQETTATGKTNDFGYFRMSLPAGEYEMSVSHPEYNNSSNGSETLIIPENKTTTWNHLLSSPSGPNQTGVCKDNHIVYIGPSYGERHSIFVQVKESGLLISTYKWTGDAESLSLLIIGPDGKPRRIDGASPLSITTEVTNEILEQGTQWEISVINFHGGRGEGTIQVNYPCRF